MSFWLAFSGVGLGIMVVTAGTVAFYEATRSLFLTLYELLLLVAALSVAWRVR